MGTTRIIANIDRNVIHSEYHRDIQPGEDTAPVDITVKLIHQYLTPQSTVKEIELQEIEVPAAYLNTSTGLPGTTPITQTGDVNIANPRYNTGLFIEIMEVRDSTPVITRVPVLNGEDPDLPKDIPEQPFKDPEHESNIPETLPERNISTPHEDFTPVIYELANDGIGLVQASQRWFLEDNEFKRQEYNQALTPVYIENSITNFLTNPGFTAGPGTPNTPEFWQATAPGLMLITSLDPGDAPDTNTWTIRSANTNPFNAFDSAKISMTAPVTLNPALSALTISLYYQLMSDYENTPFTDFVMRINFYNATGGVIATREDTIPAGPEGCDWLPLYTTVQGADIPHAATHFDFELEMPAIGSTDPFSLKMYIPQAEAGPVFTTRTLDDRVQDRYQTLFDVELKEPLFFAVKARHINGPGVRGLVSTTTDLKDGIHFQAGTDRLRLKQYDAAGVCLFNLGSDEFTLTEGDETEYGVFFDGTDVEFYLDGVLLSSHTQAVTIDQTLKPLIGSLERSNTTINTELIDFRILKRKP